MQKADLDWKNLTFGFHKTDCNIRYTWKDGAWSGGTLSEDQHIPIHIGATSLHYGQTCFEGLKVFEQKNGDVVVFRVEENAKRLIRSCEKIFMAPVPEQLFIDAVYKVVNANLKFVPPYGTGASLYVRPFVFGSGPQVGVKPADEYTFMIFVTPVGPYFRTGFKPVHLIVEEEYDRAAPNGIGDVKVGGNYAAGLRASFRAKEQGYTEVLYLDAKEKRYIDESGPANFFGITKDNRYITPQSDSILPSITNMSLVSLAEEMGLNPERRPIDVEEIFSLKEAGCCGTAAVITPVGSITYGERKVVYSKDGNAGPIATALYNKLTGIQLGDEPDTRDWIRVIQAGSP
ncbi:MAG: branched-chain amino acid aminotransferase [Myxococcota bacterium]|nr:branched-chain amino acid aminotransferase [Myxococcota bacterium]